MLNELVPHDACASSALAGMLEFLRDAGEGDLDAHVLSLGDVRPLMPEANRAFFGPELSLAVEGESRESGELRLNTLDLTTDAMTLDGQVRIGADGWPALIDVTGRIAHDDDTQVVLPVAGGDTEVQVVDLSVQYDASEGDAWTAEITLDDLSRPDLSLGSAALTGNGTLTRGTGSAVGRVQGGFDIDASQLAFSDPGLASGVGDALTGRFSPVARGANRVRYLPTLDRPGPLHKFALTPGEFELGDLPPSRFSRFQ